MYDLSTLAQVPLLAAFGVVEISAAVAVFVVGFVAAAGATRWWLNRKEFVARERVIPTVPVETRSSQRRREKSAPHAAVTTAQATAHANRRGLPDVMVATSKSRQRECPKCHRSFPDSVVICPHDASRLSLRSDARHRVKVLDGEKKPSCSSCGRRYETGTKFCRFDGQRLVSDRNDRLAVVWVCRTCGDESLDEGHSCEDGAEVVKVDPSDSRVVTPMVPLMVCELCHKVCGPEVTECPNEGSPLVPLTNVRVVSLAPLGVGPRRRICPACGRRYSGAARFCAYDGEKLSPLN